MSLGQSLEVPLSQLRALRQSLSGQSELTSAHCAQFLQALLLLVKVPGAAVVARHRADSTGKKPGEVHACLGNVESDALERWMRAPDTHAFFERLEHAGQGVWPATPLAAITPAMLALRLDSRSQQWLLLTLNQEDQPRLGEILMRARLVAEWLSIDSEQPSAGQPDSALAPLSEGSLAPLLSLLGEILRSERFQTAGYTLVNGLSADRPEVDQAALGWCAGAYMRARFISHLERFERKTETVRLIEAALEEAVDQDQSIRIGADESHAAGVIDVAHRQLAAHLGAAHLISLPLHDRAGTAVAALLLVSLNGRLDEQIVASSYFLAQTAMPQLEQLHEDEGGAPMRLFRAARRGLGQLLGPENLWVKALVLLFSTVLLASMVLTTDHRISGAARMVTDETRLVVAPWAGRIAEVHVTSGDTVQAGSVLLTLDTEERLLQLAELQAEQQRIRAELDRARANFDTVETAIAEARLEQTRARMAQIQRQMAQASLTAPFDGVVVEGDRRDLISASVNPGQQLMRVAETRDMYLSIEIPEAYIHHVTVGRVGELALVARPNETIPIVIERVIPMARGVPESGAVFDVTARLDVAPESWWRPGMTGVVRITGERRSYLWIAGHRAWNQLRLWLWW